MKQETADSLQTAWQAAKTLVTDLERLLSSRMRHPSGTRKELQKAFEGARACEKRLADTGGLVDGLACDEKRYDVAVFNLALCLTSFSIHAGRVEEALAGARAACAGAAPGSSSLEGIDGAMRSATRMKTAFRRLKKLAMREAISLDPENLKTAAVLRAWWECFGPQDISARELTEAAVGLRTRMKERTLGKAVMAAAKGKNGVTVNAANRWLDRHEGAKSGALTLVRSEPQGKVKCWHIELDPDADPEGEVTSGERDGGRGEV